MVLQSLKQASVAGYNSIGIAGCGVGFGRQGREPNHSAIAADAAVDVCRQLAADGGRCFARLPVATVEQRFVAWNSRALARSLASEFTAQRKHTQPKQKSAQLDDENCRYYNTEYNTRCLYECE